MTAHEHQLVVAVELLELLPEVVDGVDGVLALFESLELDDELLSPDVLLVEVPEDESLDDDDAVDDELEPLRLSVL